MENSKKFADMYQRMADDFNKVSSIIKPYSIEVSNSEDIKNPSKKTINQSIQNIIDEMNKILDKMEKIGKVK